MNYVHYLPTLNAILHGTAAILLTYGFYLIKNRRIMLTAFGVSVAFLISYLVHHAIVGLVTSKLTGPLHTLYLTILLTHTVLAATVPVLAIITLNRALKSRFDRHVAIAHWTLPIWLYVSVTGVVVYLMLYHL